MSEYPQRVTVEFTNDCNRSCAECPRNKTEYPIGYMKPELLQRIADQLPHTTIIVPFFRGESLKHPQFADMLYRLQGFKEVQLASNGDLLTEDKEEAIRDCCTTFSLSLHEYRLPHEATHISFLKDLRGHVATQVSIVDSLLNGKERFISEWRKVVDRVRIYREHSITGYGDTTLTIKDDGSPCKRVFTDMLIYWDGKVGLCCQDWNNHLGLGNAAKMRIREIWNNHPYQLVRQKHLAGQRRTVPSCANCHQWSTPEVIGELYT